MTFSTATGLNKALPVYLHSSNPLINQTFLTLHLKWFTIFLRYDQKHRETKKVRPQGPVESHLRRQTEIQETLATGSGIDSTPQPGCLPVRFEQRLECRPGTPALPAEIFLDRDRAIIKRRVAGVPITVVVPAQGFDGVMVRIVPGATAGDIVATLVLKHPDSALSITLAETAHSDDLAVLWSRWAQVFNLPMLVCDLGGKVKPIEAFSAAPAAKPSPRRKMRLLTGRRPRFLNRRLSGRQTQAPAVHANEREIIARS